MSDHWHGWDRIQRYDVALKRCEGAFLLGSRADDTPKKAYTAFVGDVEMDRIVMSEERIFAILSGRAAVSEVVSGVSFAQKLSETGCFAGVGWKQPVDELFAYFVQSPLWSDAAR